MFALSSSNEGSFFFFIFGVQLFNDSLVSSKIRGMKAPKIMISVDCSSTLRSFPFLESTKLEKLFLRALTFSDAFEMTSRATSGPGLSSFLINRKVVDN